jgi:hypothetical protein
MAKSKKQRVWMENSGEITWGEIKRRAAKEADEVAQAIRSELQQFCRYVMGAFSIAVLYACASRTSPERRNLDSGQFLSTYIRLVENLKRADKLLQISPNLLDKWPQAPNTMLGPNAGSSALHVAYKFSQRVKNAVTIARAFTFGVHGENFFDVIVPYDERVRAWLDAAIGELQARALPPLEDWPIWQLNRDVASLMYQLLAEKKKEAEQPASGHAKAEQNDRPILSDTEQNILEALGTETMTGEVLAKRAGYPYNSNFKNTLSSLRKRGILGNKSPGYFVESKYHSFLKKSDQGQD